jgi:hypothetical protein
VLRATRRAALALATLLALAAAHPPAAVWAAAPKAKVDELCKALLEDSNYKVRVQAAIVLGKLGDVSAVDSLIKALDDANKTVRGIAAQALGQIGDGAAADPLRALLQHDVDPFVKGQAEKALAMLNPSGGSTALAGGSSRRAKIYLNFGPFAAGSKNVSPDAVKIVRDVLQRELGKLQVVTTNISPVDQKNFAKSGMLGFFIDGNVTHLDDTASGSASETSCDVKVLVARWPSKSIISGTNAGATVRAGSRPRDKDTAHHDCLEASAGQLAEDLTKFFKSQGG